MGTRVTFEVTATSRATPAQVYALLRSGATWPSWSPIGAFALARPDGDGGEGIGAVRLFTTGGVRSREEIVELTPDTSIGYRAIAGLPIRDHRADVRLAPNDRGTTITWREDFRAKVPGTAGALGWFLRRFVQQCADGLAAHAAGPARSAEPSGPAEPAGTQPG